LGAEVYAWVLLFEWYARIAENLEGLVNGKECQPELNSDPLRDVSFLMSGVIGSEEPEGRFAKNFGVALLECLPEAAELVPYALIVLTLGLGLYLVAGMVYHLMFDPNAVDVASRLDLLSIDPDKWVRRW
jgi:hypothetical protein